MAANKVASLPELLAIILAEVPPVDLLLNQRVCKQWRDMIHDSRELQEKLFLQPTTVTPCHQVSDLGKGEKARWTTNDSPDSSNHHITVNPFLHCFFRIWDMGPLDEGGPPRWYMRLRQGVARQKGPFRKMQLATPPVHDISCFIVGGGHGSFQVGRNPDRGLTIGRFLDKVCSQRQERATKGREDRWTVRIFGSGQWDWPALRERTDEG